MIQGKNVGKTAIEDLSKNVELNPPTKSVSRHSFKVFLFETKTFPAALFRRILFPAHLFGDFLFPDALFGDF